MIRALTIAIALGICCPGASPGAIPEAGAPEVFVRAALSTTEAFVGQQIVHSLSVFTRVPLAELELPDAPVDGFVTAEVAYEDPRWQQIHRRTYRVRRIRSLLLPQRSGRLRIPARTIRLRIRRGPARPPPAMDAIPGKTHPAAGPPSEPMILRTEALQVRVQPLPDYQGVLPFSGLIGRFTLRAELDTAHLAAGESTRLRIILAGRGNLDLAAAPEPRWPRHFRVYTEPPQETITLADRGLVGRKVFCYDLVPLQAGRHMLPPVAYVCFDPREGRYRLLQPAPRALTVTPASTSDRPEALVYRDIDGMSLSEKRLLALIPPDLLAPRATRGVLIHRPPLSPAAFLGWLLLPALLYAGLRLLLRMRRPRCRAAQHPAARVEAALSEAGRGEVSAAQRLEHLYRALTAAVGAVAGEEKKVWTSREVAGRLMDAGCPSAAAQRAAAVLEDIETARYGDRTIDGAHHRQLEEAARDTIAGLLGRRGRRRRSWLGLPVMLAGMLSMGAISLSPVERQAALSEGLQCYRQQDFAGSVAAFSRLTDAGIVNGELFYNVGTACLQAGRLGPGVWWYERARKLRPADAGLRHNLQQALASIPGGPQTPSAGARALLFFWRRWLGERQVQISALGLHACGWLLLAAALPSRRSRSRLLRLAVILWVPALVLAADAGSRFASQHWFREGIILPAEAMVRAGPAADTPRLFALPAGRRVAVVEVTADAVRVTAAGGRSGWLGRRAVGLL